jgi:DNA repair exonuclease SbcCD ATPase subunit
MLNIPTGHSRDALVSLSTVTALLTSTALVDPAAKTALGLDPEEWPMVAQVELAPAGENALKLIITVLPTPERELPEGAAKAMLNDLTRRGVEAVAQTTRGRLQEAEAQLAGLRARRDGLRETARKLESRMAELQRTPDRGAYDRGEQAMLRHKLEAELAEKEARLTVLRAALDPPPVAPDAPDPAYQAAVQSWLDLVTMLEKLVEAGQAERLELLRARTQLAEARTKLLEQSTARREEWRDRCKSETVQLEADIAGLRARLQKLPEAGPTIPPAEQPDIGALSDSLNKARTELRSVERELQEAERQLERWRKAPRLVVLKG